MFRKTSIMALAACAAIGTFGLATAQESKEASGTLKSALKELTVDLGGGVKIELLLIPAGEFLMGSPDSDKDAFPDEKPQHRVRITKPFYLGKYPVTQEQWIAVMGYNPSQYKGLKNPVDGLNWDNCQQFVGRMNQRFGAGRGEFRLPSEAQWEYACRAGSTTRFYFGDDGSKLGDYTWYDKNSTEGTHPVGLKKPNAWGLYDMQGNVWEWCNDWDDDKYYAKSSVDDPTGPAEEGIIRVYRGGAWFRPASLCRSAARINHVPGYNPSIIGLRVALVPGATVIGAPAITNSIGMKLTPIPLTGEFKMGSSEASDDTSDFFNDYFKVKDFKPEMFKHEHPQHRVRFTRFVKMPFFFGTYHVTRGQFGQFVKDTGYKTCAEKADKPGAWGWNSDTKKIQFNNGANWLKPGFEQTDDHPVVCVGWEDARAFCKWLSKKDGHAYRLPTEAEWEYACRAGTSTRYCNGDDPEKLAEVGNVADAALKAKFPDMRYTIKASDGYVFTSPVGSFQPNAFGLYDMHGNVWQWCSDAYDAKYYNVSPVENPTGPENQYLPLRVRRGGSWFDPPFETSSTTRTGLGEYYPDNTTGFRVVRED